MTPHFTPLGGRARATGGRRDPLKVSTALALRLLMRRSGVEGEGRKSGVEGEARKGGVEREGRRGDGSAWVEWKEVRQGKRVGEERSRGSRGGN